MTTRERAADAILSITTSAPIIDTREEALRVVRAIEDAGLVIVERNGPGLGDCPDCDGTGWERPNSEDRS